MYWRWRSRPRGGRPKITEEIRRLIRQMAEENAGWGAPKIHGELQKLGFELSERTVARYLRRIRRRGNSGQRWLTLLKNHREVIVAFDLFTVPTLTFKTLYVLIFIAHGRRELVHVHVTANPTAAWVWRQVIEATPWGQKPRHVLRDRDAVYGRDFRQRASRIGIDAIATPVRSPRANAVAELMSSDSAIRMHLMMADILATWMPKANRSAR